MTREEIVPQRLSGATAVVVDVFLTTTTLLTILENGARRVFPVASLGEGERSGVSSTPRASCAAASRAPRG
jgi:2-phosphosulfolactate phosphatase